MKEHLCNSRNDIEIVFNNANSHAATHFEDTPELRPVAIEVLQATDVAGEVMFFEHDLGRIVGTTDLVETSDDDTIVYAKRKNRDTYTRFSLSQKPQDCSSVVVYLEMLDSQTYELSSAWIGYIGPSFPGDKNETPESKPYWNEHALVWGRQEIQAGTETSECPW